MARPIAPPIAVLLMAYGSPDNASGAERFFTHIRGGKRPAPEAVNELRRRYEAIGGHTPFWEITKLQAARLQQRLDAQDPGKFRVYLGLKHWAPFIDDTVERMTAHGIERVIAIVLAPHNSALSVGQYRHALDEAVLKHGATFDLTMVESWHDHPQLVAALARRVAEGLESFDHPNESAIPVVFTAHSLPSRALNDGDPYKAEVGATAYLTARAAGLHLWDQAFQSAGMSAGDWLGPDVREALERLRRNGHDRALVANVGFVCDHLEILFDLDVDVANWAHGAGMEVRRTASLNAEPDFIGVLEDLVQTYSGTQTLALMR